MTDDPDAEHCMCNNLPHAPHNARTREEELEQERDQYASAIRHLIWRIKQTACIWSQTLPETVRTEEVVKALGAFAPMPLPEGLRDDLWQRIVGAYYVRFENDGHPEDSEAAADEAMAIVQPELDRLRKHVDRRGAILRSMVRGEEQTLAAVVKACKERDAAQAALERVRALHQYNEDAGYCDVCSNHGDIAWPCATIAALGGADGEPRAAESALCAECGHPKAQHEDADEPVSVGLCTTCDEDDSDGAQHNYEPEEQQ
ncbi:hypothetical protein OG301_39030 (plasmid) [Streptomyces platensis]|uniref:hypothetical protein n=1 Tax=Streptomyces platensis TaxID=58346 RepID=UPI002ED1A539|nr:hypothetical protein OG301_39030 [Streptomyces platensis]